MHCMFVLPKGNKDIKSDMNIVEQLFLFDFKSCANEMDFQLKNVRLHEYVYCLLHNCRDPSIKSMHIFVDSPEALTFFQQIVDNHGIRTKVQFILFGKQPTYKDFIEYIQKTFQDGEIVCIMNADIIFNSQKDHELIRSIAKPKQLISLTRHELTDEKHTICHEGTCTFTVHGGSSDVFIFMMPLTETFSTANIDYKQNILGVEPHFHKAFVDSGYSLINPCDDIITIHIHRNRIHFNKYEDIIRENEEIKYTNLKTKL